MSDPNNNIECFSAAWALIMRRLMENFPRPITLDTRKLVEELPEGCREGWGVGQADNMVAATLRFLGDEGYVRYSGEGAGYLFTKVVLSAKGFSALHRTPAELRNEPSLMDRLKTNFSMSDLVGWVALYLGR